MRRRSHLTIRWLFLLAGVICFSSVSCLPSGDQLRSLIQNSILSGVQTAIQGALYQVIPSETTTNTTTT
jgi:hypothetical protein